MDAPISFVHVYFDRDWCSGSGPVLSRLPSLLEQVGADRCNAAPLPPFPHAAIAFSSPSLGQFPLPALPGNTGPVPKDQTGIRAHWL